MLLNIFCRVLNFIMILLTRPYRLLWAPVYAYVCYVAISISLHLDKYKLGNFFSYFALSQKEKPCGVSIGVGGVMQKKKNRKKNNKVDSIKERFAMYTQTQIDAIVGRWKKNEIGNIKIIKKWKCRLQMLIISNPMKLNQRNIFLSRRLNFEWQLHTECCIDRPDVRRHQASI